VGGFSLLAGKQSAYTLIIANGLESANLFYIKNQKKSQATDHLAFASQWDSIRQRYIFFTAA